MKKSVLGVKRSFIIISILLVNISLLIPVWQSASNTQLKLKIAMAETILNDKQEEKALYSASIASRTTPEYLIEQSGRQNIVFTQMSSSTGTMVASIF